jgi:hypothetical protein
VEKLKERNRFAEVGQTRAAIKLDIDETEGEAVEWITLVQDRVR